MMISMNNGPNKSACWWKTAYIDRCCIECWEFSVKSKHNNGNIICNRMQYMQQQQVTDRIVQESPPRTEYITSWRMIWFYCCCCCAFFIFSRSFVRCPEIVNLLSVFTCHNYYIFGCTLFLLSIAQHRTHSKSIRLIFSFEHCLDFYIIHRVYDSFADEERENHDRRERKRN